MPMNDVNPRKSILLQNPSGSCIHITIIPSKNFPSVHQASTKCPQPPISAIPMTIPGKLSLNQKLNKTVIWIILVSKNWTLITINSYLDNNEIGSYGNAKIEENYDIDENFYPSAIE